MQQDGFAQFIKVIQMIGLDGANYDNLDQDGRKRADNLKVLFDMLVPSPASSG